MNFLEKLKGYPQWGRVLGVIVKLRWFDDHNYLEGFCNNYNYNYEEIQIFLKVSNAIIEGQWDLYTDLKNECNAIRSMDEWTNEERIILNNFC